MPEDLILGFICGAIGSLVLWLTIGRHMMLKYAGESVINAFNNPTPELEEALDSVMSHLWKWLNDATIEVAGPPTDQGGPTKVMISPLQNVLGSMIDEIVRRVWIKISGGKGGIETQSGKIMDGLGIPRKSKGQSNMDFALEQLSNKIMPKLEEIISSKLDNIDRGKVPFEKEWSK